MAKTKASQAAKAARTVVAKVEKAGASASANMDSTLASYAESLGTAMGNLRNRVDDWKGQRSHLVKQLSTMVSDAQTLLNDLGHNATERIGKLRRGRKRKGVAAPNPAGALKAKEHRPKKRGLSSSGRAAISAAQKARWESYRNKRIPK
jgi:hypothetical protein